MKSRFFLWLIISSLIIPASGAWAQQSAPTASNQTLTTGQLSEAPKVAQCSLPPAFDQKSVAAFKQQATSGHDVAQCVLGMMYESGKGVPQDYTQAAAWFRKAAEQGNALGAMRARAFLQHWSRHTTRLRQGRSLVSQGGGTR